jgi:glycosyltransferase involved in cell wall biosynthesis
MCEQDNHPGIAKCYPLITIGIPTYNRAALVRKCIEGAFAQTYANIDVMVSDNASTDDTLDVLRSIKDPRLRILTSPTNVGAIENFSRCIREAKGDYLVLLSDDNFLDTTFLERSAIMIRAEPGLPIVLAAYRNLVINEFDKSEQRIIPPILSRKLSTGILDGIDVFEEYCHGSIAADSLSVVVRTDILRNNNHYNKKEYTCACDKATWMPALLEGRVGLINEPCATYLIHDSSISSSIAADDRINEFDKAMKEIAAIAARRFSDGVTQDKIKKLSLTYLSYQVAVTLVIYRRAGANLTDVVTSLWNWRAILKQCTLLDFMSTMRLRSLARILLPKALVRLSIAFGLDRRF